MSVHTASQPDHTNAVRQPTTPVPDLERGGRPDRGPGSGLGPFTGAAGRPERKRGGKH